MSKQRKPKRTDAELGNMIGGGHKLFKIMLAIVAAVQANGGKAHYLDKLDGKPESASLLASIAELIIGKLTFPVAQVAWGVVLTWIIAACRFTTYVHPEITAEHFPLQPGDLNIKTVVELFTIDRDMSTPDIRKRIDDAGFRPATLLELLWWWLTNPDKQANCLVVALGSVWSGRVPYVGGDAGRRRLLLRTVADGWGSSCAFAVVRK